MTARARLSEIASALLNDERREFQLMADDLLLLAERIDDEWQAALVDSDEVAAAVQRIDLPIPSSDRSLDASPIAPPPHNMADHVAYVHLCDHPDCRAETERAKAAPPGEPTCKTWCGTAVESPEVDVVHHTHSVCDQSPRPMFCTVECLERHRRSCPDCAASPEVPRCAEWCGTKWSTHSSDHGGALSWKRIYGDECFCTPACRDADRPLHPAQPGGSQR